MKNLIEFRLRTVIPDSELEAKVGKVLTLTDINMVLTGPAKVVKPDGKPLCIYLPGHLREFADDDSTYRVLHSLRNIRTDNRGLASGSQRVRRGEEKRTRSALVRSTIVGAFDPGGPKQFCRLTAWTGKETEKYKIIWPMLQSMSAAMKLYVPERWEQQSRKVNATNASWVIPDTVFSTVTVNNTYPTGVHTDKGDLAAGFSTLACVRKGEYSGGTFCFPRYRVGVDMKHGDLLLLDAHEYHGNTQIVPKSEDAERISVVAYYRENMTSCGSPDEEYAKATEYAEKRGGVRE